jgi:hypothetical protein
MRSDWATIEIDGVQHIVHSIHGRSGWAERAADLGWDTLALFGCHPTRPLDHLNGAGLLWRISGGKISSMETDWATIEINGAQHP